jgi:hypothetical protein
MSVNDTIIVAVSDAIDDVEIEVADPEAFHSVMAECGIKNVVLESNLSRRDRYVVRFRFAL